MPRAVRWLTETPRTLYSGRAQSCPTGRRLDDAGLRSAIDADPYAPATDEAFWKDAQAVWPRPKETVTIRLDGDLLDWRRRARGYQTRIDALLRAYMKAHTGKRAR